MSPRERSPEEREAARRERERRRYERAGEPIPDHLLEPHERAVAAPEPEREPPAPSIFDTPGPDAREAPSRAPAPEPAEPVAPKPEPAAHAPEPAAHDLADDSHDPQATQQWDVTQAWLDEVDLSTPTSEPAREAARRAPKPEPPVPPVPPQEDDPHATKPHDVQADWGQGWDDEPLDAPPGAGDRDHDAHDDAPSGRDDAGPLRAPGGDPGHDEPLGTKRVSARDRRPLPNVHRPAKRGRSTRSRGRGVRVKRPGEVAAGVTRVRRPSRIVGRVVALFAVLLAAAVVYFAISIYQPFGGGGEGSGSVTVRIPQGATAGEIGDILADNGVVKSGFFFKLRAQLSGERGDLKSGTFRLRRDMSYASAIDALTHVAPPPPMVTVAIPEGRSRLETAAIARRDGLRGNYVVASRRSPTLNPATYGAPRGATLEGFLFPATYQVKKGGSVRDLVTQQLRAFKQNFKRVDLSYARSKRLTPFDVLTIASMVEREVSVPRERPLVAAVIYNRLRDGMNLGIDATLRFERNDWVNPLTESVLERDTPYNTRLNPGLPPGPIGSPGMASIQAAAHPARSDALYYVVKPGTCGEHAFSSTDAQFEADVAKYNNARAAAGGKSPERC
jgi:uncharacterized YceG family protein